MSPCASKAEYADGMMGRVGKSQNTIIALKYVTLDNYIFGMVWIIAFSYRLPSSISFTVYENKIRDLQCMDHKSVCLKPYNRLGAQ